ncbi:MAG: ABC transporter ATP-binding protein [Desulfobacter sp.]
MDVRISNISFSYGEAPILRDLSCTFSHGRFHAILGPNGSGKTTLLDIISGFTSPDNGEIRLGTSGLGTMSRRTAAQTMALVSQNYAVNFPFTVYEVVLMGRHPYVDRFSHPTRQDRDLAVNAMSITGITHLKDRKITELSGGEKQRCIFARALCQDTPVLLLDEAFSNMDINHTLHLLALLKKEVVSREKTVIAVLHDLNLAASWSDTLVFLKDGAIKARGNTADVFTEQNIQTVFNVDAKVEFNEYAQARQAYFKAS